MNGFLVWLFIHSLLFYISGSWYQNPDVSTINYVAVHIQGNMYQPQQEGVVEILSKTNQLMEALCNSENPREL